MELTYTYTSRKPPLPESIDELRARIPGWGADRDPQDRPSVPRLREEPTNNGAHWDFPERQPEKTPRERSIEHGTLTPVFGTTCPLGGVSGAIRRFAYDRFSEARAAHWLLLLLGDRVESTGAHLRSLFSTRPDNPITETGVLSEIKRHPVRSRFGRGRADLPLQPLDPLIVAGPYVAAGAAALMVVKRLRRNHR
jgi:hypothetical protein